MHGGGRTYTVVLAVEGMADAENRLWTEVRSDRLAEFRTLLFHRGEQSCINGAKQPPSETNILTASPYGREFDELQAATSC
ncbi:hypothetical protein ACOSQ2_003032 [Xanthoceras sorbifolium]